MHPDSSWLVETREKEKRERRDEHDSATTALIKIRAAGRVTPCDTVGDIFQAQCAPLGRLVLAKRLQRPRGRRGRFRVEFRA